MPRRATSKTFCTPTPTVKHARKPARSCSSAGKGVFVYDDNGKDYIEAMAGLWCTALGWGENELVEAAAEQMRKLAFAHLFAGKSHEPAIALAEKLKEIAPFPVGKVFFANSGSEANDTQIKLFWYANNARGRPKKKKIISPHQGLSRRHDCSASLTGLPANHNELRSAASISRSTPIARIITAAPKPGESEEDFSARLAANLEAMIEEEGAGHHRRHDRRADDGRGRRDHAAEGLFRGHPPVLRKHDMPLIDDEVITGFGRTGQMVRLPDLRLSSPTACPSPRRCRAPICRSPPC